MDYRFGKWLCPKCGHDAPSIGEYGKGGVVVALICEKCGHVDRVDEKHGLNFVYTTEKIGGE